MTLRITQKLHEHTFTEIEPMVYTTGAYLSPMRIKINNKIRYVWVVDEYNDDTYVCPSGKGCSPRIFANSAKELLVI